MCSLSWFEARQLPLPRAETPDSILLHGTLTPRTLTLCAEILKLDQEHRLSSASTFIDVGSGYGKVTLSYCCVIPPQEEKCLLSVHLPEQHSCVRFAESACCSPAMLSGASAQLSASFGRWCCTLLRTSACAPPLGLRWCSRATSSLPERSGTSSQVDAKGAAPEPTALAAREADARSLLPLPRQNQPRLPAGPPACPLSLTTARVFSPESAPNLLS